MTDTHEDDVSDGQSGNEYEDIEADRDEQDDDIMTESLRLEEHGDRDGSDIKKPKLDPKDPLRPRRKKARRACFACQRAHLTCGDERPCQRCIKRGLADACQDGVRKKAKYLHDAPPEALRPVLGPTYNPLGNGHTSQRIGSSSASDTSPVANFFGQGNPAQPYTIQYQAAGRAQMPPPLSESLSFTQQQSPISPSFQSTPNQRPVSMQGMASSGVTMNLDMQTPNSFSGPLYDASNPALFNFDLEGLNFGNHYGALEFGMLNHMSSGAAETPPQEHSGSISQASDTVFNPSVFGNNMGQYGQMYTQQDAMMNEYVGLDRQNSSGNVFDMQRGHGLPKAYAIEAGQTSMTSPSTDAQQSPQPSLGFDSSPTTVSYNAGSSAHNAIHPPGYQRHSKRSENKATSKLNPQAFGNNNKRTRDPSSIYTTVTEPYPYTTGFHSLTAFIQRRFSASSTLRIAKSLASIRPSFISCTKTLNRQDLIFMEKCFQRTLFEYEEFMRDWGTPTLVCRRTGEVAAVNEEFTHLTGWRKNVLLGKEPNMNINTGKTTSETNSATNSLTNTGRAGLTTPRMRPLPLEKGAESRPHSVFLAELLDDNSVIEFYEDFAKLAFGDSRGSVRKRCKLLNYQTKDETDRAQGKEESMNMNERKRKDPVSGTMLGGRVSKINGEHGIGRLSRDGKMECAYCWTVKRDVFDIPMLIVMNFLPCI